VKRLLFNWSDLIGMGLFLSVISVLACCSMGGGMSAARSEVKGGLDVINAVVTPASKLAFLSCNSKETLIADQAEAAVDAGTKVRAVAAAEARAELAKVRKTCDELQEIFDHIRVAQNAAVDYFTQGDDAHAKDALEEANALFQQITTKLGDSP
jgi:hypothetical protein